MPLHKSLRFPCKQAWPSHSFLRQRLPGIRRQRTDIRKVVWEGEKEQIKGKRGEVLGAFRNMKEKILGVGKKKHTVFAISCFLCLCV